MLVSAVFVRSVGLAMEVHCFGEPGWNDRRHARAVLFKRRVTCVCVYIDTSRDEFRVMVMDEREDD